MEWYFLQASIPVDFHESTQVALWTTQRFEGWAPSVQILAYGSATTLALLSNIIIGKHQEGNSEYHQGHSKDVFFLKSFVPHRSSSKSILVTLTIPHQSYFSA